MPGRERWWRRAHRRVGAVLVPSGGSGADNAATAAAWAQTDAARQQLAPPGITTTALPVGSRDTDMIAHIDAPENAPATPALDGVQAGVGEVLADDLSRQVRGALAGGAEALYPSRAAVA